MAAILDGIRPARRLKPTDMRIRMTAAPEGKVELISAKPDIFTIILVIKILKM